MQKLLKIKKENFKKLLNKLLIKRVKNNKKRFQKLKKMVKNTILL